MKLSLAVKTTSLVFGIALSVFAVSLVVFAWTGPTQAPPGCPAGARGCDRPLHEGITGQIKTGPLEIQGVFLARSNVGIGTTAPGTRLDVAGTARMTGFQLGTTATAGHVLTTNASGVGTWQAAPSAAPVTSVFGRTGAVAAATGDYSVAQITGAAPLASPSFTGNVSISGNIAAPNNSYESCSWQAWTCADSMACPWNSFMVGVARGIPGSVCGSFPNQWYQMNILCCQI